MTRSTIDAEKVYDIRMKNDRWYTQARVLSQCDKFFEIAAQRFHFDTASYEILIIPIESIAAITEANKRWVWHLKKDIGDTTRRTMVANLMTDDEVAVSEKYGKTVFFNGFDEAKEALCEIKANDIKEGKTNYKSYIIEKGESGREEI